jgi:amino acid transporter
MSDSTPASVEVLAGAGPAAAEPGPRPRPGRSLSLFDATCIIAGIIIGAGIFETAPAVAACARGPAATLGLWLAGGLLALIGALCYAELATAYPRLGGDYVYQSRAFGRGFGFLFGWSQLAVIRPGDIALLAFVFGRYGENLLGNPGWSLTGYAAAAIAGLTAVNLLGVRQGKRTQNLLTVVKVAGLLAIVGVALFSPLPSAAPSGPPVAAPGGLALALILILFTYGGWSEIAYVAAEIRNPRRNILRSLVIGTAVVTAVYLLMNAAFLRALGFGAMAGSEAVAADTAATLFPRVAGRAVSALICISALGAINGLIFTGARISYAVGEDHPALGNLGRWSGRRNTPAFALAVQGVLSIAIVMIAGSFINTILYTAPLVWFFFIATGISVFVLRRRDPGTPRPYRVSLLLPALFCALCIFMFYSCVSYAWQVMPKALLVLGGTLLSGTGAYALSRVWSGSPLVRDGPVLRHRVP